MKKACRGDLLVCVCFREIGRGGITRPHARYMRDTTTLLYCIVPLKFI